MTDEKDPEELLQQSKEQSRHTSEPSSGSEDDPSMPADRQAALKAALLAIDDDEISDNIGFRDRRLKALLVGLENTDALATVAATVADKIDADIDGGEITQSEMVRLLIRAGLSESVPELREDLNAAAKEVAADQVDDY